MDKHTPLPWKLSSPYSRHGDGNNYKYFTISSNGKTVVSDAWIGNKDDAALIVKAVNAHAELVAIIERFTKQSDDAYGMAMGSCQRDSKWASELYERNNKLKAEARALLSRIEGQP